MQEHFYCAGACASGEKSHTHTRCPPAQLEQIYECFRRLLLFYYLFCIFFFFLLAACTTIHWMQKLFLLSAIYHYSTTTHAFQMLRHSRVELVMSLRHIHTVQQSPAVYRSYFSPDTIVCGARGLLAIPSLYAACVALRSIHFAKISEKVLSTVCSCMYTPKCTYSQNFISISLASIKVCLTFIIKIDYFYYLYIKFTLFMRF